MARENKASVAAVISNQEILAEINLISQIQQIETRFATEPDSIRFAQLADAYLGIGDFDHAIKLCEQGLIKHPQYDTGTLVLAKSYYLSGNKNKAREVLQDFLITHPASLAGHKLLGDLSLEEDDVTGTVSHYRIALRFDPINRQIIQTLVDLKDKYQKIKELKASDEEDEDVVKTVAKKAVTKTAPPESSTENIKPVSKGKPGVKTTPVKEDNKLDSFIEDAIQPMEEQIEFKPTEVKPLKTEPAIVKPQEPKAEEKSSEFAPAYTDENGLMYFYDDDEVSFEQYKKRLDLQKAGKALILERALLDQKLSEKGIKSAGKVQKSTDNAFAKTESAFDMDITAKGTEIEPKKETSKKTTSFEEHIDESMAKEEEELLSAAEQEAALSEIDMSYKDYLDILTNEDELLEALFQEEHEAGIEAEKEDKASRILATTFGSEKPVASKSETDQPIPYLDYVQTLTNESEIEEASFMASSEVAEKEESIGLSEFSSYLDHAEDTIDYTSYAMLMEVEGIAVNTLWDEEPVLNYNDYLASAPTDEKTDSLFETPDVSARQEKDKKTLIVEPAVEDVLKVKTVEESVMKVETVTAAEEPKFASQVEIKEEVTEETAEAQVEEFDEEINPQDATPELVEKLASRGQYGSAYKVCKMLKVKNPTDAKVDRKILELKRLYVWSSQMVG